MEVWVVMRDEDDWDMVLGVYATRASADASIREDRDSSSIGNRKRMDEYTIVPTHLEN